LDLYYAVSRRLYGESERPQGASAIELQGGTR